MAASCPSSTAVFSLRSARRADSLTSYHSHHSGRPALSLRQDMQDPPVIQIEELDETPFSQSFSELFEYYFISNVESFLPALPERSMDINLDGAIPERSMEMLLDVAEPLEFKDPMIETSFNVEQITNLKELDSQWDDDEIDEIIVISPRLTNRLSPLSITRQDGPSRPDTSTGVMPLQTPKVQEITPTLSSLKDFDLLDYTNISAHLLPISFIRHKESRHVYVIKRFVTTTTQDMLQELSVLETLDDLDCPFVPRIRWRVFDEHGVGIITDSHPGGSLLYYVLQDGPLDDDNLLLCASEIAEAISTLHSVGIRHRDLNPSNILIGSDGHFCLTGFDFACSPYPKRSSVIPAKDGSNAKQVPTRDYEYRAPELLLGWTEDEAVDSWSFGCLLYFMAVGKHAFEFGLLEPRNKILTQVAFSSEWCRSESRQIIGDLISECMECNPRLRLNVHSIKAHPYFASMDWAKLRQQGYQGALYAFASSPTSEHENAAPYIPSAYNFSNRVPSVQRLAQAIAATTPDSTSPLLQGNIKDPSPQMLLEENVEEPSPQVSDDQKTPVEPENFNRFSSTSSSSDLKPASLYSLQARHSVQDLLPKIFRSPSLDEHALEESKSRFSHPEISIERSPIVRVPSYQRLTGANVDMRPEERMALFWENIDQDVKVVKPSPKHWFGKTTTIMEAPPSPPSPLNLTSSIYEPAYPGGSRYRKLRKQRSSIITSQTQRISQLFTRASMSNLSQNKSHKIRRPKSTPVLHTDDKLQTLSSDNRMNKVEEHSPLQRVGEKENVPLQLPSGIKQIGNGIGYTFKHSVPDVCKTKASICSGNGGNMAGIGSGSRLGLV
ncbi:hypothetical protein D9758_012843 [Tetrapyrgos nigripes]|uniref:non-specific serine/threonine protein kinase n=1 Tax=Tetrapyrgos nigripes TaxID=182062 RepID=A0A8H5FIW1_9AGAR|nr:hypothetical protein D9758_012843 [Tetrapyrgos nigripes]